MKNKILVVVFGLLLAGCAARTASREIIDTKAAPTAIGPYSQAVRAGDMLFLAGQIAINPDTDTFVKGGIEEQTRQVLKNIQYVLKAAGFSMADITVCQVFLSDLNNYSAMNAVYASFFQKTFPARAAVEVARLPKDALIEIMATAVKSK